MQTNRFLLALPLFALALLACKQGNVNKDSETVLSDQSAADSIKILYIGTYTGNENNKAGKSAGIYIYGLNMNTGRLSKIGNSPQTVNPSYLAVDPERQRLFAVNEIGGETPAGQISAFRLTDQGRGMEFINSVPSEGNYPCYIALDGSGNFVMCANYGSGTVALFPVRADGSLENSSFTGQHKISKNPTERQESAHAHMILLSPDKRFVYSCDLGSDKIYLYKLDTAARKLVPTGKNYSSQSGAGPRHMTFHPGKDIAYVVNELNGTIEVMQVDVPTGILTRIQTISTVDNEDGKEASCADIHLTPSGKYLYASNRGDINNLAMYTVDQESGKLTLIGHQSVKGKTPRNFIIDPEGIFLLVANQDSDNVVTFTIDQATGKLIDTGVETQVPSPVCIKFLL